MPSLVEIHLLACIVSHDLEFVKRKIRVEKLTITIIFSSILLRRHYQSLVTGRKVALFCFPFIYYPLSLYCIHMDIGLFKIEITDVFNRCPL